MARTIVSGLSSVLQYDFCPWANHYVYWLKRPIGWVLLAFAASLLLGIYVSQQAFLAAGIVAAVGIIGAMWPWISMLGIRGELSWNPSRCEEWDAIETELNIINRWPWPAWGLVVQTDDAIACQIDAPDQPISLSKVPGWTRTRFRWTCQPKARGIYPKHQVRLKSAFPFGLWSSSRILRVDESLVVWPRLLRLTDVPDQGGSRQRGLGGVSQRVGDDGDWMGVRPYRSGDSLRQVHWAQTARRDSLVVFERQSRSRQSISIVLDALASSASSIEERDWMVRVLASIACHCLNHSWNVRVRIGDRWHSLHNGMRSAWLDQLAAWEPEKGGVHAVSLDREPGIVIGISSSTPSVPTQMLGDRTPIIRTLIGGCESVANDLSGESGWQLNLGASVDDQLREVWRSICQLAVEREAHSAS